MNILFAHPLAIMVLGLLLDSLEAKGNHLVDISARNAALKGTSGS